MPFPENFENHVQQLTGKYFTENNHNCAESVFRSLLEASGIPYSVETISLASPFGRGMGGAGCCCGSLVGAQMAVGKIFGRKSDSGYPPDICAETSKLMHKRFVKANGTTCCRILHKGLPFGTDEQLAACKERAVAAAGIAAQVLLEAEAKLNKSASE